MTDPQAVHAPPVAETEPCGDLCIRTLTMPADTNQNGDIFGGWLLSQMDLGGGVFASKLAKSRTVTVAIEAMNFRKPVYVGDLVSVHANLVRIGKTSITVHLEAWVLRRKAVQSILVTDGNFTYVAIDDQGHPQVIKQPDAEMIDRLILPMSNVCVACLREGIVDDPDMVDGAMIFGTGYAPFRGGPLNYARTRGAENVASALRSLAAKFGGRFTPDAGWDSFK